MRMFRVLLAVILIGVATPSSARLFGQLGLHIGGDTIAGATIVGGGSDEVKAGQLLSGALGLEGYLTESILMKASIGLKMDFISASNGDITFIRVPAELLAFYVGESISLGVGVTQHLGPTLEGDGVAAAVNADFDDATGFIVQLDYPLNEKGYLAFRYTSINYNVVGSSVDIDGSSIGIIIGVKFGD